ncbi:MAG: hypothetical protein KGI35_18840 [Burkholderiales bacterium]|nr:hypothetical protein [Burkholderiales bacterium]MDE2398432.1 hypothetical protein [Burkholderiales bacterium]
MLEAIESRQVVRGFSSTRGSPNPSIEIATPLPPAIEAQGQQAAGVPAS